MAGDLLRARMEQQSVAVSHEECLVLLVENDHLDTSVLT